MSVPKAAACLLGGDSPGPQGGLVCGVSSSVCVILHLKGQSGAHLWEEAFWVQNSEQNAWHVAWWRATPPPKPFPGSGFIFRCLCPNFPAPDSFTGCRVLTSPL